jgi:CarD family transcriptional regulator, regulator of rRNA transcription
LYKVGEKVVYPHHGAGTIVSRDTRQVGDQEREYLTVDQVIEVLQGDGTKMPKNWNRRFKHNRDKMKTGDIFEMAEVVRNLAQRDQEKGLSTGEKQMFSKAKRILASELMYAKNMDEDEAREFLEEVLEEIGEARRARA